MEKTGIAEERFENKNLKYNIFSFCVLRLEFSCCSLSTAFGYKERTLLELGTDYAVKRYSQKAIFNKIRHKNFNGNLWAKLVVQFFVWNIYGLQPVYGISSLNFKFSKSFIYEKSCKWLSKSDCLPCNLRQAVKKVDIFKCCNKFDKKFLWNLSWHTTGKSKNVLARRKSIVFMACHLNLSQRSSSS